PAAVRSHRDLRGGPGPGDHGHHDHRPAAGDGRDLQGTRRPNSHAGRVLRDSCNEGGMCAMATVGPKAGFRAGLWTAALLTALLLLMAPGAWAQGTAATSPGTVPILPSAVLPDPEQLPPDLRAIRERGYLIVAMMVQDRYPFYFVNDDGEMAGLEVDFARDIARHLGVDVVFDRTPETFNGVVDYVAAGKADIGMSKLSITLPRAQQVLFTRPYIILPQTVLVNRLQMAAQRAGNDPLHVLRIPGQRIGVMNGSVFVEY